MKYCVNYQYKLEDSARPFDNGACFAGVDPFDKNDLVLLPNVGDFVHIHEEFSGRVKSKYFSYTEMSDDVLCVINIVVEEDPNIDWGSLIKE